MFPSVFFSRIMFNYVVVKSIILCNFLYIRNVWSFYSQIVTERSDLTLIPELTL